VYTFIYISAAAHAIVHHPKKPQHVSFTPHHTRHCVPRNTSFRHITECQPEELRTAAMSCTAIYGNARFNFGVACPLHALLSKILHCYKLFPSLNSCFTILFHYFSPFPCLLSATNRPRFPFYLARICYKIPVHRKSNPDNYYPSEQVSETRPYFVLCPRNFVILSSFTIRCLAHRVHSVTPRSTEPVVVSS
jgi:hypothetical protein